MITTDDLIRRDRFSIPTTATGAFLIAQKAAKSWFGHLSTTLTPVRITKDSSNQRGRCVVDATIEYGNANNKTVARCKFYITEAIDEFSMGEENDSLA